MPIPDENRDKVKDDDAFIISFPRSGNTWMRQLIACCILSMKRLPATYATADKLVPDIHISPFEPDNAKRLELCPSMRLIKCHEPRRWLAHRMVYILRRPEDVLNSLFFHAAGYDDKRQEVLAQGIDAFALAERSKLEENIDLVAKNLDPARHFLVAYEQMMTDCTTVLKEVMSFLGIDAGEEACAEAVEANRFEKLKKQNKNPKRLMFRAGVIGDSKNHMKPETIEEIRRTTGEMYRSMLQNLSISSVQVTYSPDADAPGSPTPAEKG